MPLRTARSGAIRALAAQTPPPQGPRHRKQTQAPARVRVRVGEVTGRTEDKDTELRDGDEGAVRRGAAGLELARGEGIA